jgi:DNA-directed RNA polymerase subunit RPC12/RpoP
MPRLVCRACGKSVYTTEPFEALYSDERRCPRCGKLLFTDRRSGSSRRTIIRRVPPDPEALAPPPVGPVDTPATPGDAQAEAPLERRAGERRKTRRRRDDHSPFTRDEGGWIE